MSSSVNILGNRYKIIYNNDMDDFGVVHHTKRTITLQDMEDTDWHNMVLLHEIVHGLEFFMGLKLEENQVQALGNGILSIMQKNPKLIHAILEGKKYGKLDGSRCS